ncbi:MAG: CsgG/HfaB family protein [Thermodesulfobacteriota bacterium]|nr:CsgG/HfaB family protein [Thermodesulfobacteriota bacterium]
MSLSKRYLISFALFIILTGCATTPVQYEKDTSIAIWEIENLSPVKSIHSDLGDLLSSKVIETFSETGLYTVVERQQLLLALEELKLGTTSLVDESARLQVGKLVGARVMVFGGYQVIENIMRLDLRLVEVGTGKIIKTAQRTVSASDVSGWLKAAQEATKELLDIKI